MLVLLAFLAALFVFGLFPFWSITHLLDLTASRENKFSRDYVSLLETGDTGRCAALLSPRLQPGAARNLPKLESGLKGLGEARDFHLLNVSYLNIPGSREKIRRLVYYADFEKGSVLFQIALQRKVGSGFWIDLCEYSPLDKPFSEAVRFDFGGKPLLNYLFLLGMLLIGLFSIWTVAQCLRSNVRLKWLWVVFILFGFSKFGLNWNDGSLDFNLFGLQVFSAGLAKASIAEPWMVWMSFPLGATLFYIFKNRQAQKRNVVVAPITASRGKAGFSVKK